MNARGDEGNAAATDDTAGASPLRNPYAPPTFVAPAARRRSSTRADLVAIGMIAIYVVLNVAAVATDASVLAGQSTVDGGVPRFLGAALGLVWLGRRWAGLPAESRNAVAGKPVGAWLAVLFHFLPFFNLFWMFKAQTALRDAVNEALRKTASNRRMPREPAVLAPLIYLCCLAATRPLSTTWLYLVPVTLMPAAWTLHMALVERAWAGRRKSIP